MASEETKKLIVKHDMIPVHKILTEDKKKALLEKYNIQPEWLPLIKASDPVIRALGGKPGDIVEIERISQTAGEGATFYRYVIKG